MSGPDTTDVAGTVAAALEEHDLQWQRIDDATFAVALPGERRLKTACVLTVGTHALEIEAFVCRAPEENHAQVHSWLLRRNARMYGVSWALDAAGDIYLTGRVSREAVTVDEIDRLLGCVLEYADGSFNLLLEMGFGSSIRREWAWRVKNNESLANLTAFRRFAAPADDATGANEAAE